MYPTPSFCVCGRVGADITVLREREVDYDSDVPRKITEVLVRKVPDNQQVGTCDLATLSCWRGFIQGATFWDGSPDPRATLLCKLIADALKNCQREAW